MLGRAAKFSAKVAFPRLPSSLNAGDHEMQDYYHADGGPAPVPVVNTTPSITPYLGLPARLSQVWINRWTVLLALVLARILLAVRSLDDNLGSARKEALSACTGVESMGSAMASMPHYMSQGVNELAATGVEKAVNGLMSMLALSVTTVEELVVFMVNLLTSTYVCLLTLVIGGSMQLAIELAKDVGDFLNKTLGDIGNDIKTDVKSFQDGVNKFSSALNSVPKIFGSDDKIPELKLDGPLEKMGQIKIPSKFDNELNKLNASIPTFAEVQNFTNNILRTPFREVKERINETMVAFKFDRSVFPVPAKEKLSFCSDNDGINDFFDKLIALASKARRVFMGVLIVAAILVCIPMAYREIWRWRTMQKRAQLVHRTAYDPVDVIQISSRPTTSTIGIKAAARFGSTRRQILVRWFFAYITSTPALFLLSLGFAGLFACLCHYILLKTVEKEVPALAQQVGNFAGKVVRVLNNASEQWAIGTNRVIDSTNQDINREVLGWVNTTTGAVNNTLNTFVDRMSETLNTTFGGTVLYDPVKEVLNCLIGIKIAGIQKGLTWVSDHAKVEFPQLANNTFSLGAVASVAADSKEAGDSFLADPSSKATDKISNAVAEMVEKIEGSIRTEAIISAFLLLLWVIVALIGLSRVVALSCFGRTKTRAEGGGDSDRVPHWPADHRTRTRHSSFFFPHVFRSGPESGESPRAHDAEFYAKSVPSAYPPAYVSATGGYVPKKGGVDDGSSLDEDEEEEQEKVGYAGMRRNPVVQHGLTPLDVSAAGRPEYQRKSSHGVVLEKSPNSGGMI
ncbi:MAG: plasma membrane fusion protein prm1 [Watsoniomyces obsoletus]|nr:MAG: plasma membrane fusion protein prm1 [Watsoniomyces obsoletus]